MSHYRNDFSLHEFNDTSSTFLYQVNEAPSDSRSILNSDFLRLNELQSEIYHPLPTPRLSSTVAFNLNPSNHSRTSSRASNISNPVSRVKSKTMERLAQCSTFSGYSQDNAKKFLSEFKSYALLHDLTDYNGKKVAGFHLHLKGPALTWFNNLSEDSKRSWVDIEILFEEKFIDCTNHSSMAMMEGQIFNALTLGPNQKIEDFHSQILEKGTLLRKPDHEILARFITGLPDKMAFFVRAGQPSDLTSALTSAKMAETCGYRDNNPLASNSTATSQSAENKEVNELRTQISTLTSTVQQLVTSNRDEPINSAILKETTPQASADITSLTEEVSKLSKTVNELVINKADTRKYQYQHQQNFHRGQTDFRDQHSNSQTCFSCHFPGHKTRDCNWNGQGYPSPGKCQLCRQQGHQAYRCRKQTSVQSGNARNPGDNRPSRLGYRN